MIKKDSTSKENVFKDVVRVVVREELEPVYKRLEGVEKRFDFFVGTDLRSLKTNLNRMEDHLISFEDKMEAGFKKFRSDVFDLLDPLMGEIKKYRENQSADAFAHRRFDEEIEALKKAVHLA